MSWLRPDWLFSPQSSSTPMGGGAVRLRNLTLDVETLYEAADEFCRTFEGSVFAHNGWRRTDDVIVQGVSKGFLRAEDLLALSSSDRNSVVITTTLMRGESGVPGGESQDAFGHVQFTINSPQGIVTAIGSPFDMEMQAPAHRDGVVRYLYENAYQHPDWKGLAWLRDLIPVAVAVLAWVILSLSTSLPWAAHIMILALIVLGAIPCLARARAERGKNFYLTRRFTYRGESRQRTAERRADHRRDWQVGVKTGILTFIGTALAGLIWFLIAGDPSGIPNPSRS